MANTQELRRKIKSVRSTAKLTKAMQMVAAAKMARAVERAVASREYADAMDALLADLAAGDANHPLLATPEQGRRLLILLTSNRGLAGAFNSQVIRAGVDRLDADTDVVAVGRRGEAYMARFHTSALTAAFPAPDGAAKYADATAVARLAVDGFLGGQYRDVRVIYTGYVSAIRQEVRELQLLPLASSAAAGSGDVPRIEPNRAAVLDVLLARAVPMRLFRCLLESAASEQSARMLAMKNATDNANDIVDELTLTYQSVRQAGITRQIIEIASGAAALAA